MSEFEGKSGKWAWEIQKNNKRKWRSWKVNLNRLMKMLIRLQKRMNVSAVLKAQLAKDKAESAKAGGSTRSNHCKCYVYCIRPSKELVNV